MVLLASPCMHLLACLAYSGTYSKFDAPGALKLQREKEKAEIERKKEKRRDKQEKKREKKEKKRQRKERKEQLSGSNGHVKQFSDTSNHKYVADLYGRNLKSVESEADQLEKSSITEEHEQPMYLQNASESSESTHSSYKRRRQNSSINGSHNHGNIIRIRLPLQRHTDAAASVGKEEEICSTSGRMDPLPKIVTGTTISISQKEMCSASGRKISLSKVSPGTVGSVHMEECGSGSGKMVSLPKIVVGTKLQQSLKGDASQKVHKADEVPSGLTSRKTETLAFAPVSAEAASGSKSLENEMRIEELPYERLIENWVPPSLPDLADCEEDWLFSTKGLDTNGVAKRCKLSNEGMGCRNPTLWPCSNYLPEADIFALPYTVPF